MLISQCHFNGPPLKLMGPLLGPMKPTAFLKPMGPLMGTLKSMGPGVIVPPSRRPCVIFNFRIWNLKKILQFILMLRSFSRSFFSYARILMMLVVMTNTTSIKATRLLRSSLLWVSEVESSRTHSEVLGLGLDAYKYSKISLSSAKDSTIFWIMKILLENARNLAENLSRPFFRERLKKKIRWPFFWRTLTPVPLVLGLEHFCPWPRLRIFLCPWPRALCPRLHFWWLWLYRKNARIRFVTKMQNLHCLLYT